jgi:transglutaminase/protease-like cytokinesis protein 3
MSELEKEKAVHDYLVINTEYDMSKADASNSPYGTLIKHKGLCKGYTDSFKIFMDALGIESSIVLGTVISNEGELLHSWNKVRLDSKSYYVDVTWDDPAPDQGSRVTYKYFNVSEEVMSLDHKPNSALEAKGVVANGRTDYNSVKTS